MIKTYTEQWREGTLPKGLYYTRSSSGRKGFSMHTGSKRNMFSPYDRMAHQVVEVLSPVPDYYDCKRLMYDSIEPDKAKIKIYELVSKTEQLEKKLAIATKALSDIEDGYSEATGAGQTARQALKEMDGVK